MAWDPKTYLDFSAERTRPAAELLARVKLEVPRKIADLGCGPGNSTELLARRWPDAELEGIDSSQEMLAEARRTSLRVRWTEADIAAWDPPARYDLIFSNATYQWVSDHAALLPRLASFLEPGGVFAFQVPRNFDEPCHTLIHEIAAHGPWSARFKNVREAHVLSPEAYFEILEPIASRIDIWETRYLQILTGEDAVYRWMIGTGLRPFASALDGEMREAFLAEYRTRVAEIYVLRKDGVTLYPFQRLFCVAQT
jgi:trans-aconitate 2-methyltransferase